MRESAVVIYRIGDDRIAEHSSARDQLGVMQPPDVISLPDAQQAGS
jgi:hypothetical protein